MNSFSMTRYILNLDQNKIKMDIDEPKKRKVDEKEVENVDLETVLKAYIESSQNMAKLIAVITQKVVGFEKVFNKDLFKPPK